MSERTDPMTSEERAAELLKPRPRGYVPIAPGTSGPHRALPLADEVREIDRRWRPIYAVWETTLACDQACRHCGSRAGRERSGELTTAEALDVVRQLAEMGVPELTLTGGETYLREDWTEIIREAKRRGIQCSMVTAGRGLTPERARAGAEAGLCTASVSVDGNEEAHDRLRGIDGSHRSALQALKNLRAAGIPVSINTQINRLSLADLPDVLETAIAHGVHAWQIQLTLAMGRASDEQDVLLQPYDILDLFEVIPRLKQRCTEAKVVLWPGNNIGYFGPCETLLRGTMPRGHLASCGAGRGIVGIEADGTIKGCSSLPTEAWTGGTLKEHSLKDIFERAPMLRYTRDRSLETELWGFCKTCYYADVCRAGCTSTAFVLFGRAGNMPYCHHRALEMRRAGKRERLVKVKEAPGSPMDWGGFEIVVEDDPAAARSGAREGDAAREVRS